MYVLSFASWLFGKPKHIHSRARIGFTGVDEHAVMQLVYEDGELAALTSAITLKMPIEVILSRHGRLSDAARAFLQGAALHHHACGRRAADLHCAL